MIEAIKKYAFESSDYPVILSLENHCSLGQQTVMAKIMIEVFGDLLCKEIVKGNDGSKALPSPEQLKKKILIKGKAISQSSSSSADTPIEEEEEEDVDAEDELDPEQVPADMKQEAEKAKLDKKQEAKVYKKVAKELSDITIYCRAAHFKSFETSKAKGLANEVYFLLNFNFCPHLSE